MPKNRGFLLKLLKNWSEKLAVAIFFSNRHMNYNRDSNVIIFLFYVLDLNMPFI